jgi:hypothetical protein
MRRLVVAPVAFAGVVMATAFGVLALARAVDAVVLCARPRANGTFNTAVKIRQTCLKGETQLDPGALGLQGPPGPGLVVKDANNALVGAVLGTSLGAVLVARQVGGSRLQLLVNENGFLQDPGVPRRLYESTDCSDPAWLDQGETGAPGGLSGTLILPAFRHGTVAFYPTAATGTMITPHSLQIFDPVCAGGVLSPPDVCCLPIPQPDFGTVPVLPFTLLDLSTLGLVPPFHVVGP